MPLILLGLIVVIGIVIYALVRYGQSDDEPDLRSVRERYPFAFPQKKGANYTIIDDDDEDDDGHGEGDGDRVNKRTAGRAGGDGHTMYFPDNAELEKRKRDIH